MASHLALPAFCFLVGFLSLSHLHLGSFSRLSLLHTHLALHGFSFWDIFFLSLSFFLCILLTLLSLSFCLSSLLLSSYLSFPLYVYLYIFYTGTPFFFLYAFSLFGSHMPALFLLCMITSPPHLSFFYLLSLSFLASPACHISTYFSCLSGFISAIYVHTALLVFSQEGSGQIYLSFLFAWHACICSSCSFCLFCTHNLNFCTLVLILFWVLLSL